MRKTFLGLATVVSLVASSQMFAADCELAITRTACAGKEKEALEPYKGEKTTKEKKPAANEAACKALAEKSAEIVRKGVLTEKSVAATFDGKPVGGSPFSKKAECN